MNLWTRFARVTVLFLVLSWVNLWLWSGLPRPSLPNRSLITISSWSQLSETKQLSCHVPCNFASSDRVTSSQFVLFTDIESTLHNRGPIALPEKLPGQSWVFFEPVPVSSLSLANSTLFQSNVDLRASYQPGSDILIR